MSGIVYIVTFTDGSESIIHDGSALDELMAERFDDIAQVEPNRVLTTA